MIGFLLKLVIVAAVAVGSFSYFSQKNPHLVSDLLAVKNQLQSGQYSQLVNIDADTVKGNLAASLDSLVTHNNASPVVLGVKVTNDSLNAIVDIIQKMPPGQVQQLKDVICQPATSSANN